jgi:hypothetical protein
MSGPVRPTSIRKDDHAAYHWLRMAGMNAARVLEQTRNGMDQLRSRLDPQELKELEQQISRCVYR